MTIVWYNSSVLLFLLPLCVVVGVLLLRRYLWQKRTAHMLGADHKNGTLLKHFSLFRKFMKALLLLLGLVFLSLALARPQWGESQQTVAQEGRDVLIALDISRSMLAQDTTPSRIEAAKEKIKQLITRLTAERVSLMVFSGIAVVQCPFTSDTQAFLNFLDLADVEAISSGTTALDKALNSAITMFEAVPGRKQRLMILFTDGEDFSIDLSGVEKKAQELGLRIFTVGVGTPEGAPIPLYDMKGVQQGHQKDEQDKLVITRLNEQLLSQLAQQTGATYIKMTSNDDDVQELVKEVQRFEKEKFEDKTFAIKEERYMLFAGLSALLLLVEWML